MSASKKSILSKLKKTIKSKSIPIPQDIPQQEDINQTRLDLFNRLSSSSIEDMNDIIKTHISYFPQDSIFGSLLNISDTKVIKECIIHVLSNHPDKSIMMSFTGFIKQYQEENQIDKWKEWLSKLHLFGSFKDLILFDPYVFDPLLSLDLKYYNHLYVVFIRLIDEYIKNHKEISIGELQQEVKQFIHSHRFDFFIKKFQNTDISDKEKQDLVVEFIHLQFENIKSIRFFIRIMNLIENNVTQYSKPLEYILFQFVEDQSHRRHLFHVLSMYLDIIINKKTSQTFLSKYFNTKTKLNKFITDKLPKIQTDYEDILHKLIINEVPQSFIYEHAHKIKWRDLMDILLSDTIRFVSLDVILLRLLTKQDRKNIIDTILQYVKTDPKINKHYLNNLIYRLIDTYSSTKEKQELQKLYKFKPDELIAFLETNQSSVYVDELIKLKYVTKDQSSSAKIDFKKNHFIFLQKNRLCIPDFDHVSISPIDQNIDKYISTNDFGSSGFFLPNQRFYNDLYDLSVTKTQKRDIFYINNIGMRVANVTIHNEFIIQDEKTYKNVGDYIRDQMILFDIENPLAYFDYFYNLPLVSHMIFKSRIQNKTILSNIFSKKLSSNIDIDRLVTDLEGSIFVSSDNVKQYTYMISLLLLVIDDNLSDFPKKTDYFINNILKFNISELGKLQKYTLSDILIIFFPEYHSNPNQHEIYRLFELNLSIIQNIMAIKAYYLQFPMRRIPILSIRTNTYPINYLSINKITDMDKIYYNHKSYNIDDIPTDEMIYPFSKLFFSQEQKYIIPSSSSVPSVNIITPTISHHPLDDFISVAFDMLDTL